MFHIFKSIVLIDFTGSTERIIITGLGT